MSLFFSGKSILISSIFRRRCGVS